MFSKILVANRGEIAIRAFRAAYELGAKTVAVFPYEDRNSIHRQKSDEAYHIGEEGHPVRAYLDVAEIVRVAKESGADAIYPGYGFLSENPDLARAAEAEGITFVGPRAEILELAGNKVEALRAARRAGIPTLESSDLLGQGDVDRGRGEDRLPGVRQGRGRWRWPRHATRGEARTVGGSPRCRDARGGHRVR